MEMTSFEKAPMLGYQVGDAVRFCDGDCMRHYRFHSSMSATQIMFHNVTPLSTDGGETSAAKYRRFLTVSCGLLDTDLQRNKVLMHFYALLDSSASSKPEERVCVLVQARFDPDQRFLAFLLSSDLVPVKCLPDPSSSLSSLEERLIVSGLQSVMYCVLDKFGFADFYSLMDAVFEDESSSFPRLSEIPSQFVFIDSLPSGFKFSKDEVVIPKSYNVVFHDTKRDSMTVVLVSESGTLLALFYKHSVDCVIRVAYAVERDPLAVVETKELPCVMDSHHRLLLDSCRDIVCAVLADTLLEERIDKLKTSSYK